MRTIERMLSVALVMSGALALGCGDVETGAEPGDVEVAQAPLLQTPGAFYNTPPTWGFCGYIGAGAECHGGYSFNSRGVKPSFLKRGVGMYRVTFENQPTNGNVQVVAASGNNHCTLAAQFPSGTGVGLDVFCRAPSGALVDSKFMMSYYRDTNVGGPLGGYANVNGVAPFTTSNTWNSTGGPIGVVSMGGLGNYRVTFTGQATGGDNAQVTALTSGGAYCTLASTGWTGGAVDVRCYAANGAPANVPFSVSYGHNVRGEPRNALATGTQGALVVVGPQGGTDTTRSRNSCVAGASTAVIQTNNTYVETYHAITSFQGEVPLMSLVTAWSNNGTYCNLTSFPIQGVRADSRGTVSCFTPAGASTTSIHSTQFIIQDRTGC